MYDCIECFIGDVEWRYSTKWESFVIGIKNYSRIFMFKRNDGENKCHSIGRFLSTSVVEYAGESLKGEWVLYCVNRVVLSFVLW